MRIFTVKQKAAIFSLLLCAVATTGVSAREPFQTPIHFSVVQPLSTHGKADRDYINNFSFALLTGLSNGIEGVAFAGIGNSVVNYADGVMFAGVYNYAGGNIRGLQFAGVFNRANHVSGVQFGGVANHSVAGVRGLQFAGVYNIGSPVKGIQFAGLANMTAKNNGYENYVKGLQFAGLYNCAQSVNGLQFAGVVNMASRAEGLQFAGVTNMTGEVSGMQFAGLFNKADEVRGSQFAGLFNVAGSVSGLQFAGLLNVARSSDYPLGLINIIREGEIGLGVTYNELGSIVLSMRSGGRVLYGIIGGGYNHRSDNKSYVLEGGFGAHINISPNWRINNELKAQHIGSFSKNTMVSSFAVMPSYRISRFEIFAGPSINFLQSNDDSQASFLPNHSLWKKHKPGNYKQLYVGYTGGINILLSK